MIKENLRDMIDAGMAKIPADIVIKNGQLVNVTSSEIYPADVAIYRSRIVATGECDAYIGDNTRIIDAEGKFLCPGLIDGHLHIECSKMSMTSFAKAVVPCGTTSIVSGLDQYLVTAGLEGVREVLDEISEGPLKVFWGLPFTTPYTLPKSTVGFDVTPEVHKEVQKWPEVFGVWETVSEFVENKHDGVMGAIETAQENNLPVFGCAPMTTGERLNGILSAGVRLDHESYDHKEAMEKIRKGMFLLIRESSISHFLNENMKVVTHINPRVARRVSFCTDDVIPSEILENGHMDKLIRMTIAAGVDPITAIQMGSLNSAEAYRIDHLVGSISPGKIADILFVDDLREFSIDKVIAKGKLVVDDGKMAVDLKAPARSETLSSRLKIPAITAEDMKVRTDIDADRVKVLSMEVDYDVPFVRKRRDVELNVENGVVLPDVENDVLYATVVERFGKNGNKPVAFVSGWKLKGGAMASSKAPDDNNIMCIGTNSEDMALAINYIAEKGGGQVIVKDGEILDFIHLPICGITSDIEPEAMAEAERKMKEVARELGCDLPDPVFYMCCLQITAIPDYAMTDLGAVDFHTQDTFNPVLGAAE
ncbi:adenine deaminase [Endozoicomonas lisbonensis]|uniref:Adenine deaminase n=1 Tax=Endozoicomonas lisbonensis TaxID=3120522 RepID=A0ABV2SHW6_9GAMM